MGTMKFTEKDKEYTISIIPGPVNKAYGELLTKWKSGQGSGASMADVRLLGVRNYKTNPDLLENYHHTTSLYAQKGDVCRFILPRADGQLSPAIEQGLGGIADSATGVHFLKNGMVDLDYRTGNGNETGWSILNQWENDGGVLTRKRKDLFYDNKGNGKPFANVQEAKDCPANRILFGYPETVESDFAITAEEYNEIFDGIFNLREGKPSMGIYLSEESKEGRLTAWLAYSLNGRARSYAWANLDNSNGRVPLFSVGDAGGKNRESFSDGLEQKLSRGILVALEGGLAFEHNGKIYVPINAGNVVLK